MGMMHIISRTMITSIECQKFPNRCGKEKFYSGEQFANHGDTASGRKPKVPSTETRGRLSFIKFFPSFPNLVHFIQMRFSKQTFLIGLNCAVLIVWYHVLWLVGKKANEDVMVPFWLDGPGLSPLITKGDQELPYNGWLKQKEQYRSLKA